MKITLYIETNFLMSIATGREPKAERLLSRVPTKITIVIPSICCMEALSAFEDEKKRRNRFRGEIERQIGQLTRDLTSKSAKSLLSRLEQAKVSNEALINDIWGRLRKALKYLSANATRGRIIKIDLTPVIIQNSLDIIHIEDPTDNLILSCILNHSFSNPTAIKVFLSGNSKDFDDNLTARSALSAAGIKYLSRVDNFLGWLQSQP